MCIQWCPVAGFATDRSDTLARKINARQEKSASFFSEMLSICKSLVPFFSL